MLVCPGQAHSQMCFLLLLIHCTSTPLSLSLPNAHQGKRKFAPVMLRRLHNLGISKTDPSDLTPEEVRRVEHCHTCNSSSCMSASVLFVLVSLLTPPFLMLLHALGDEACVHALHCFCSHIISGAALCPSGHRPQQCDLEASHGHQ